MKTADKTCKKCSLLQPRVNFYKYHSWCKNCEVSYTKEYLKTATGKASIKKWRTNNPEKCNELLRDYRKRNPRRFADYDLRKRIGITLAQKEAKLESQGGLCAICSANKPNTKKTWFADHCHKTKKFRGVLCGRCNSVLGYALDSPDILVCAAAYLLNNSQLRDELVERKNDEFAPVSEFD